MNTSGTSSQQGGRNSHHTSVAPIPLAVTNQRALALTNAQLRKEIHDINARISSTEEAIRGLTEAKAQQQQLLPPPSSIEIECDALREEIDREQKEAGELRLKCEVVQKQIEDAKAAATRARIDRVATQKLLTDERSKFEAAKAELATLAKLEKDAAATEQIGKGTAATEQQDAADVEAAISVMEEVVARLEGEELPSALRAAEEAEKQLLEERGRVALLAGMLGRQEESMQTLGAKVKASKEKIAEVKAQIDHDAVDGAECGALCEAHLKFLRSAVTQLQQQLSL